MDGKTKNLEQLCKDVSDNLIDSLILVEVLEDIIEGERKMYSMLTIIEQKLKNAFSDIETCRGYISVPN